MLQRANAPSGDRLSRARLRSVRIPEPYADTNPTAPLGATSLRALTQGMEELARDSLMPLPPNRPAPGRIGVLHDKRFSEVMRVLACKSSRLRRNQERTNAPKPRGDVAFANDRRRDGHPP